MRRYRIVVVFVMVLTLSSGGTASGAGERRRIDRCSAEGAQTSCELFRDIRRPKRFIVRVTASPNQRVSTYYYSHCFAPDGQPSRDRDGTIERRTPYEFRVPLAYDNPHSCTLSITATRLGDGEMRAKLFVVK